MKKATYHCFLKQLYTCADSDKYKQKRSYTQDALHCYAVLLSHMPKSVFFARQH